MPYLHLYVHRRRKCFVASALQDTRVVLGDFFREEQAPVAIHVVDDDPANGLGALVELDASAYVCTVGIGTPGNDLPLAEQELAWDVTEAAFLGVLNLKTAQMAAALDAQSSPKIDRSFEVELFKDNGGVGDEEITAQADCVVRNEVILGGSGDPTDLRMQLYPNLLFAFLRVESLVESPGSFVAINPTGSDSLVVGGVAGTTYSVRIRIKGRVETHNYLGGAAPDPASPFFYQGGTIDPLNDRDIFKLEISSPAQTYYLNHETIGVREVDLDYIAVVQVNAGATVTLSYDVIDGLTLGDHELSVFMAGNFAFGGVVPPTHARTFGRETIWMPSGSMVPRETDGASSSQVESPGNLVMQSTLAFSPDTPQYAQFEVAMPKSWDRGVVYAEFLWQAYDGTDGLDVRWGIQAVAMGDGDPFDEAFGAARLVTDLMIYDGAVMVSPETAAVEVAGSPAEKDIVIFQVFRDAADPADTLDAVAHLKGVRLFYLTNAANDD